MRPYWRMWSPISQPHEERVPVLTRSAALPTLRDPGETPEARWLLLIDTNIPDHLVESHKVNFATGDPYEVSGRSLLVFQLESVSNAAIDRAKSR